MVVYPEPETSSLIEHHTTYFSVRRGGFLYSLAHQLTVCLCCKHPSNQRYALFSPLTPEEAEKLGLYSSFVATNFQLRTHTPGLRPPDHIMKGRNCPRPPGRQSSYSCNMGLLPWILRAQRSMAYFHFL